MGLVDRGWARSGGLQLMRKTLIEQAGARRTRFGVAALVALVAAVGAVVWVVRDRSRVGSDDRAVREALAGRRFGTARNRIQQWIARTPGMGRPYYLLAKLELAEDRPQPAVDAMAQARALGYPAEP